MCRIKYNVHHMIIFYFIINLPKENDTFVALLEFLFLLMHSTSDTELIAASASPLNPRLLTL